MVIWLFFSLLKFRQINFFTKKLNCKSIWRKDFQVGKKLLKLFTTVDNQFALFLHCVLVKSVKINSNLRLFSVYSKVGRTDSVFHVFIRLRNVKYVPQYLDMTNQMSLDLLDIILELASCWNWYYELHYKTLSHMYLIFR